VNYTFHVNVFANPREASFAATWEDVSAALEQLPRMIFEPDGSFVVSGDIQRAGPSSGPPPPPADRWQVDGHLFDFAGRLHRYELHGHCPPAAFDDLLRCVGWPETPLVFETVRDGLTLDEAAFRNHAISHR
jgi:hypothetical protein